MFSDITADGGAIYTSCLVILLPTVEPSMIPKKTLPLLVFVNVKSGGCQVRQKHCHLFSYFILTKSTADQVNYHFTSYKTDHTYGLVSNFNITQDWGSLQIISLDRLYVFNISASISFRPCFHKFSLKIGKSGISFSHNSFNDQ